MTRRKPQASAAGARLKVLAASGGDGFVDAALEMLSSRQRLEREAALEALVERPTPKAREPLRALYFDLDDDGMKRDQGGIMRTYIVTILRELGDSRDADIGVRASGASEIAFGEDITWRLRAHGLMLLADLAPDAFPYHAIDHIDDVTGPDGEPANTALQLLAGTGNHTALYQWILGAHPAHPAFAYVLGVLAEHAPAGVVERIVSRNVKAALKTEDEQLCMTLAETIVERELARAYPELAEIMFAKLSDELYTYLAVLLAGTNRPELLAILEQQLHRGRRPRLVAEALRVRPTPEQEAILARWEDR